MKILIAGDTHGNFKSVKQKIDFAKLVGAQRVVVLGDFGVWWGHEGVVFLDEVNAYAKANNVQVFALPGNHENHELWESMTKEATGSHGWKYVRSHLLLTPGKVLDFVWGDKQFLVAGGAVSIDKDFRLEYERKKHKKIWSPKEQLLDWQVDQILESRFGNGVQVDYFLTHDCSNATPWKYRLKPDIDSQIHRERIDRILRGVKPRFHFHGHMHERYEWENRVDENRWVSTYGLECDSEYYSWGVLDLKNDEFTWGPTAADRHYNIQAPVGVPEMDNNF